jgi:hypothetical protein
MGEQEAFIFQSTSILLVIVDASGCVIAAKLLKGCSSVSTVIMK